MSVSYEKTFRTIKEDTKAAIAKLDAIKTMVPFGSDAWVALSSVTFDLAAIKGRAQGAAEVAYFQEHKVWPKDGLEDIRDMAVTRAEGTFDLGQLEEMQPKAMRSFISAEEVRQVLETKP